MRVLLTAPMSLWLLALYNAGMLGGAAFNVNRNMIPVPLPGRGTAFFLTISEVFAVLGILALYVEALRAVRAPRQSALVHALPVMVVAVCFIELLAVPGAATSSFALLTLVALVDALLVFTVTYATARRDVAISP